MLLLFLENHRTTSVVPAEVDFALVHALNLAEGGGTLKSRSLGAHWGSRQQEATDADASTAPQATSTSGSTSGQRTTCRFFTSTASSRFVHKVA